MPAKKMTVSDNRFSGLEMRLSRYLHDIAQLPYTSTTSHKEILTANMTDEEELIPLLKILKAIAEPKRLQILLLLNEGTPRCLCELEIVLNVSQPTITHHIKKLEEAGIIETRREQKWLLCSIKDQVVMDNIMELLEHAKIA
ncbi:MAG: ArsR/SmtB family transcription factor [Candidatus Hodarchaeales archaeon]|jgi:ArsR family transcriptional regulator